MAAAPSPGEYPSRPRSHLDSHPTPPGRRFAPDVSAPIDGLLRGHPDGDPAGRSPELFERLRRGPRTGTGIPTLPIRAAPPCLLPSPPIEYRLDTTADRSSFASFLPLQRPPEPVGFLPRVDDVRLVGQPVQHSFA